MPSTLIPTRESTSLSLIHVLVFVVQSRRFALSLRTVEKVISAVAITLWPQAPNFVAGVIDVHGQVLPVVRAEALLSNAQEQTPLTDADTRNPQKEQPGLHDHFLILRYEGMRIVLWVERTLEVAQIQESESIGISNAGQNTEQESREQRWSPIRTGEEMTLLWDEARLFDASQAQFLHRLWDSLGGKPLS